MPRYSQLAGKRLVRKLPRHMTVEDVAAFLSRRLSAQERKANIKHLALCSQCRKLVARVVRSERAQDNPEQSSS